MSEQSESKRQSTILDLLDDDESRLASNTETELDDDKTTCIICGSPISEHDIDRHDGECEVCFWSRRFRCTMCATETLVDDKHPVRAGLCTNCGDELDQVDCERLREMVESIIGRADETSDYDQVRQAMGLLASLMPEPERKAP